MSSNFPENEQNAAADANVDENLSGMCKALGHPARLKLIRALLEKGPHTSGDLANVLDLAPSTTSEHLRILKESDLVVAGAIDGSRRKYSINTDALELLKKQLAALSPFDE